MRFTQYIKWEEQGRSGPAQQEDCVPKGTVVTEMIWYTNEHLWLDIPEEEDKPIYVGITEDGDIAVGGVEYVETYEGKLIVESTKTAFELDIPVVGTLERLPEDTHVPAPAEGLHPPVAKYDNWESIDFDRLSNTEVPL